MYEPFYWWVSDRDCKLKQAAWQWPGISLLVSEHELQSANCWVITSWSACSPSDVELEYYCLVVNNYGFYCNASLCYTWILLNLASTLVGHSALSGDWNNDAINHAQELTTIKSWRATAVCTKDCQSATHLRKLQNNAAPGQKLMEWSGTFHTKSLTVRE